MNLFLAKRTEQWTAISRDVRTFLAFLDTWLAVLAEFTMWILLTHFPADSQISDYNWK